jgi:hypothetical protein
LGMHVIFQNVMSYNTLSTIILCIIAPCSSAVSIALLKSSRRKRLALDITTTHELRQASKSWPPISATKQRKSVRRVLVCVLLNTFIIAAKIGPMDASLHSPNPEDRVQQVVSGLAQGQVLIQAVGALSCPFSSNCLSFAHRAFVFLFLCHPLS